MAKGGNNAGVSILEFVGSLLFLWVLWGAWPGVGSSSLGILAPLVFGAGVITAVALFFVSLASFAWGWMDGMVDGSMMSGKWAAIATVALAVSGSVGTNGVYAAVLGFILVWVGVGMAKMK
ncbi:MAG TPA: hypothetical protein VNF06_03610 [Candidatus Aquilonibacter sp.]|nr:hypothetical protein [Candidatus Aquilonibacter sp.]